MRRKVYGVPTIIDLNGEHGAQLVVYASGEHGKEVADGVSIEFTVEAHDFYVAFTSATPAKLDRIISALQKHRREVWGLRA